MNLKKGRNLIEFVQNWVPRNLLNRIPFKFHLKTRKQTAKLKKSYTLDHLAYNELLYDLT